MAINITVDGKLFEDVEVINVGGKVLSLAYVSDSTGGDSGETTVTTYTVTKDLVNVTSSNSASSVKEGNSYTATLTAAGGYTLDNVVVTMGGVNVTATVYANGVVNIASVTGNVEIAASASAAVVETVLPEDGLAGYWDMRNRSGGTAYDYHDAHACDKGEGLYAVIIGGTKGSSKTYDAYGCVGGAFNIQDNATLYPDDATKKAFGTEYTFAVLAHGGKISYMAENSNVAYFNYKPKYHNESGATTTTAAISVGDRSVAAVYSCCVYVVNGATLTLYLNGTKMSELNGEDYTDFVSWYDRLHAGTIYGAGKVTAIAVYDKALNETELVELNAFMETLEVSA